MCVLLLVVGGSAGWGTGMQCAVLLFLYMLRVLVRGGGGGGKVGGGGGAESPS